MVKTALEIGREAAVEKRRSEVLFEFVFGRLPESSEGKKRPTTLPRPEGEELKLLAEYLRPGR